MTRLDEGILAKQLKGELVKLGLLTALLVCSSAVSMANTSSVTLAASATTTTPSSSVATTSTATVPAAAAPAPKKWGVVLLNESSTTYAGGKDIGNATVSTVNYIGGSYRITETERLGLRQYYNYSYDPKSEKEFETSDIKQSFTIATISTKIKGILGSEDIYPSMWYYLPGHEAETNNFGKDMDNFYGILRGDMEISWTLNPKWSVSYYLNPRQTFGAADPAARFEASTRLIHYGNLYYTINDRAQLYMNAGFDNRMSSERLTSTSDAYLSAIGAALSFMGGKISVYPEIGVYTPIKSAGVAERRQNLYNKDNIGYTIATAISL